MLSAAALFGLASIATVLIFSAYLLRKLGAEEIGHLLVAIALIGFIAAIAGALIS